MSAIDSLINVHIGNMEISPSYHIPLYWVQEEENNIDYSINPQDICIGGGSGEHPMLLIKNACFLPLYLSALYLFKKYNIDDNESEEYINKISKEFNNEFSLDYTDFLNINDWDLSTWYKVMNSSKINTEEITFEVELLTSLSFFLIENMPKDFFDEKSLDIYFKYQRDIEFTFQNFISFKTCKTEKSTGKNLIKGNVKWGYSLDEYKTEYYFSKYGKFLEKN